MLWLHGGGYVSGTPEQSQAMINEFADELGCLVVAVDYRLAPETPHPGPLQDCYAALRWLHGNADELGVDPDRIAIAGDSAGAGLTAALAQLARDRSEIPLRAQVLLYPMLDDRTCVETDPNQYTGEFIWTRARPIQAVPTTPPPPRTRARFVFIMFSLSHSNVR